MGHHNHSHSVPKGHVGSKYRTRLAITFSLVVSFMIVEFVFGFLSGSLALISDAGHMSADSITLGVALLATVIATRTDKTGRKTYGSFRAEVFASGFTVLVMLAVSVYVVVEAIQRIGHPAEIATGQMMVVGVLGLAINVISIFILHSGSKESLNVKGAYLEVISDAAGSVGVILAGVLIKLTGNGLWDVIVALAIGIFVAARALILGKHVLAVLGQQAPEDIAIESVITDLETVPGVEGVHDLHVWTLTSGMNVATAHLLIDGSADPQDSLEMAQKVLQSKHSIEHATLQTETSPTEYCHLSW
ncbi:cation diffusion facilitator family transporter [Propionimicrobium lymphophilum]|uniref:cation diffusion facilitator family transporter n=1 Tax=Propionimicrobium lymphophilum TaxID=33012 RepID=UPI000407E96D|nr:cation diffusion facilitator family transporter [Propionimicrobium lymphophilum]